MDSWPSEGAIARQLSDDFMGSVQHAERIPVEELTIDHKLHPMVGQDNLGYWMITGFTRWVRKL